MTLQFNILVIAGVCKTAEPRTSASSYLVETLARDAGKWTQEFDVLRANTRARHKVLLVFVANFTACVVALVAVVPPEPVLTGTGSAFARSRMLASAHIRLRCPQASKCATYYLVRLAQRSRGTDARWRHFLRRILLRSIVRFTWAENCTVPLELGSYACSHVPW